MLKIIRIFFTVKATVPYSEVSAETQHSLQLKNVCGWAGTRTKPEHTSRLEHTTAIPTAHDSLISFRPPSKRSKLVLHIEADSACLDYMIKHSRSHRRLITIPHKLSMFKRM